jgi:hypothetical protein
MRDPASLLACPSCAIPFASRVALMRTLEYGGQPLPPPMHIVSSPYRPSRLCNSRASAASIRAPVAPTGWPREIPDPDVRTLQIRAVNFHSRITANACAANASLSSIRSMSDSASPALPRAAAVAGTGPIPMTFGGTPATPQETSRRYGRRPRSAAFSGVVTMHIDAASFWPLELPAVTVDSGSCLPRMGLSLLSDSTEVSARGCSSVSIRSSPLADPGRSALPASGGPQRRTAGDGDRDDLVASRPSFCAATARRWEVTANSSCSSRGMPYWRLRFSGGFDHAAGHG